MNIGIAVPPNSSLSALRGAVGEVVGVGDAEGGWDRLVWLWRLFWALDGVMAVLWSIVDRLAAGEMGLDGRCPVGAAAMWDERPAVAMSGLVRRPSRRLTSGRRPALRVPAVVGDRAMAARRVLVEPVASLGGGRGVVGMSPVLAVRCRRFSDLGWGGTRNCVLIVPV